MSLHVNLLTCAATTTYWTDILTVASQYRHNLTFSCRHKSLDIPLHTEIVRSIHLLCMRRSLKSNVKITIYINILVIRYKWRHGLLCVRLACYSSLQTLGWFWFAQLRNWDLNEFFCWGKNQMFWNKFFSEMFDLKHKGSFSTKNKSR